MTGRTTSGGWASSGVSILVGAVVGGALFLGLYSLAENAIFSGIAAGAVGVMAAAKLVQIQARDA